MPNCTLTMVFASRPALTATLESADPLCVDMARAVLLNSTRRPYGFAGPQLVLFTVVMRDGVAYVDINKPQLSIEDVRRMARELGIKIDGEN